MGATKDKEETERINVTLRIPPGTHEQIVELAVKERRSLNNQIVFMLERDLRGTYKIDVPVEVE